MNQTPTDNSATAPPAAQFLPSISPEIREKIKEEVLAELKLKEESQKQRKGYWKAYSMSIFLPPLGLYYFIKYFLFSDHSKQAHKTAVLCLVLTVLSLGVNIFLAYETMQKLFSASPGAESILKEYTNPQNQQELNKLLGQ